MPEPPDFEQIARRLIVLIDWEAEEFVPKDDLDLRAVAEQQAAVVEQLHQVWNARGAADTATLERDLAAMMGPTAAGPYLKNLDRALRTLDR
jgi:hypothetical protein